MERLCYTFLKERHLLSVMQRSLTQTISKLHQVACQREKEPSFPLQLMMQLCISPVKKVIPITDTVMWIKGVLNQIKILCCCNTCVCVCVQAIHLVSSSPLTKRQFQPIFRQGTSFKLVSDKKKQNKHLISLSTHHFLLGAQHSQLAEAHMEGGALVGAVPLPHHHHVDAARQRGLVDALVQLLHRHKHLARQLTHVVHSVRLAKEGKHDRGVRGGTALSRTRECGLDDRFRQAWSHTSSTLYFFISRWDFNQFLSTLA